jgi:hypothetical protein
MPRHVLLEPVRFDLTLEADSCHLHSPLFYNLNPDIGPVIVKRSKLAPTDGTSAGWVEFSPGFSRIRGNFIAY